MLTNGATVRVRTTVPKRTLLLDMDSLKSEVANPNILIEKERRKMDAEQQAKNAKTSRFVTRVKTPTGKK